MGGLEKFTDYNITVLCFTDPGDGIRSQPFEVRTDEDGKLCSMQDVPNKSHVLQYKNGFGSYPRGTRVNVTLVARLLLLLFMQGICEGKQDIHCGVLNKATILMSLSSLFILFIIEIVHPVVLLKLSLGDNY